MVLVKAIEPQVLAATPVAQVTVQLTFALLEPFTVAENDGPGPPAIALAVAGEIVTETVEELLLPQPRPPNTATNVMIEVSFHHFIPVLPSVLDLGPRRAGSTGCGKSILFCHSDRSEESLWGLKSTE